MSGPGLPHPWRPKKAVTPTLLVERELIMKMEIDWREPPLSGEEKLREVMKHHSGRWARVKKDMASSTASSAWRKHGFNVQVHPAESDPKKFDIYARWPESSTLGTRAAVGTQTPATTAPHPTTASKTAPVTTKDGVPTKPKPPADGSDLVIPTSGDVTGGYLASRASRAVPTNGESEVRVIGHNPSPVRP